MHCAIYKAYLFQTQNGNSLQINDDIAEVLYYSNNKCDEALSKLLTKERLNVAAVSKVLLKGKSLE